MRNMMILSVLLCSLMLSGCSEMASQIDTGALIQQVETFASQVDVEGMITGILDSIDWEELKNAAEKGYEALTEKYPALKQENIRTFLKDNGLKLMNKLVSSSDDAGQEKARKLGEILKILYPELTEDVDAVVGN